MQIGDEIYSPFQISHVRHDLISERAAHCPVHPMESLAVTWTRKVTLDDGIKVPVRAEVLCPRCAQAVDINLLESDPPLPMM